MVFHHVVHHFHVYPLVIFAINQSPAAQAVLKKLFSLMQYCFLRF